MKKPWLACAFMCVYCLVVSGCGPLLLGAALGGVGVYAASKDTIAGETDLPFDRVWDSALTAMKYRGSVAKQDFDQGTIEGSEGKTKVLIKLEHLTAATTRLTVSARQYKMPNLEAAQQIYTKILEEAKPPVQH